VFVQGSVEAAPQFTVVNRSRNNQLADSAVSIFTMLI